MRVEELLETCNALVALVEAAQVYRVSPVGPTVA
jgi:hypothetical protein